MSTLATVTKFDASAPSWHPQAGRRSSTVTSASSWGTQPSWLAGLPSSVVVPANATFPYTVVANVKSKVLNPSSFAYSVVLVGTHNSALTYDSVNDALVLNSVSTAVNDTVQLGINLGGRGSNILSGLINVSFTPATVSWLPMSIAQVNRQATFPQTLLTNVRSGHLVDPTSSVASVSLEGTDLANMIYDAATDSIIAQSDPGADKTLSILMRAHIPIVTSLTPLQDFLNRSGQNPSLPQPGVVFFHNFDFAAEVNQFRWTGAQGVSGWGGQDPSPSGTPPGGSFVAWQSSGGADGGGFMRLTYPLGSVSGRGSSYWWRPFAPLNAAGTGRGVADPGANGSIILQPWSVSAGSSTMANWAGGASNPAWYGSASDQAANPSKYQGNDFWLQIRVRRAGTPGAPPNSGSYSNITGKNVWLTNSLSSYTTQELVTYGQSVSNGDVVGQLSRHNIYSGQNFTSLSGGQPNATVAIANTTLNWRFSGGWDCLLYHITPGTNGGTGTNRTRVEVWAQHDFTLPAFAAEIGQYVKIWDVTYSQSFDGGSNAFPGWNALILAIYHNGSAFTTSAFNFDYDQVIFSKQTIAAPAA